MSEKKRFFLSKVCPFLGFVSFYICNHPQRRSHGLQSSIPQLERQAMPSHYQKPALKGHCCTIRPKVPRKTPPDQACSQVRTKSVRFFDKFIQSVKLLVPKPLSEIFHDPIDTRMACSRSTMHNSLPCRPLQELYSSDPQWLHRSRTRLLLLGRTHQITTIITYL